MTTAVAAPVVTIKPANIKTAEFNIRGSYRDWETDRKSTRLNSSH